MYIDVQYFSDYPPSDLARSPLYLCEGTSQGLNGGNVLFIGLQLQFGNSE
jgi:hypothetical protein